MHTKNEPEMVNCSPNEMADELEIEVGDKVQLIDHLENDARAIDSNKRKAPISQILEGEIVHIDGDKINDNVVINYQIGNTATSLNCPPRRKWKTWYVGNYEVLPLPK